MPSQKLNIKLLPGTKGSQSAKRLASALSTKFGYKVWRTTKNNPKRISLTYGDPVNKLQQYQYFEQQGLSSLEYTTSRQQAKQWSVDGFTVFGRHLLNSSCGKGIEIIEANASADDLDSMGVCPVYTKYKKKKREFRVHIFKDKVVTIVEKKRKSNWQGQQDSKIRNLENGYVFCQEVSNLPQGIEELAIKASKVCSSDFKGVDIAFNEKLNDLFVIEVNSAPGIEGSNIEKYVKVIYDLYH